MVDSLQNSENNYKKVVTRKGGVRIYIAQHSGFCFGVKRAIQIAKQAAAAHKNIYIKGELVHNEEVCRQIEKDGVIKVRSLKEMPDNSFLIIKAHGEPLKTYREAKLKNLKIIDATCPMVKDIHKKAKEIEDKGYRVIIVGDRNHEETIGILGNIKEGLVLEKKSDIKKLKNKVKRKTAILCQSTQNINNVAEIICQLLKYAEEFLFINTICQPTRLRQKEIEKLAKKCEAVIIAGSEKSANTRRLYQVAKKINRNAFWLISDKINKDKFIKFKTLGIIGGASTPPETLTDISNKLK